MCPEPYMYIFISIWFQDRNKYHISKQYPIISVVLKHNIRCISVIKTYWLIPMIHSICFVQLWWYKAAVNPDSQAIVARFMALLHHWYGTKEPKIALEYNSRSYVFTESYSLLKHLLGYHKWSFHSQMQHKYLLQEIIAWFSYLLTFSYHKIINKTH